MKSAATIEAHYLDMYIARGRVRVADGWTWRPGQFALIDEEGSETHGRRVIVLRADEDDKPCVLVWADWLDSTWRESCGALVPDLRTARMQHEALISSATGEHVHTFDTDVPTFEIEHDVGEEPDPDESPFADVDAWCAASSKEKSRLRLVALRKVLRRRLKSHSPNADLIFKSELVEAFEELCAFVGADVPCAPETPEMTGTVRAEVLHELVAFLRGRYEKSKLLASDELASASAKKHAEGRASGFRQAAELLANLLGKEQVR